MNRAMETGTFSRRRVVLGVTAWALASALPRRLRGVDSARGSNGIIAYVGSYTGAVGSGGNGEGIYSFEMNPSTGELNNKRLAAEARNPSWIVIHPSRSFLYAVNEVASGNGGGTVSAFAIDAGNGELHELNHVSSMGAGPAYISLDRTGRFAFVANYGDGSVAVLPIDADGVLGAAVDVKRDSGSIGSIGSIGANHAVDGPPGSFAISGHDWPHAHMIVADPNNRFVLATDLGQDRIYCYRFDAATGQLSAAAEPFISLPQGDGPRHVAFHPNGRWVYSIQEEASTVVLFQYHSETGALAAGQPASRSFSESSLVE